MSPIDVSRSQRKQDRTMNTVRGLAVWLGAPFLASFICTAVWGLAAGRSDWRPFFGVGVMSLIFTVGGSAFLSLLFRTMSARPVVGRYAVLIGFGALAGFATMGSLGASSPLIWAGLVYGVATACLWVGLHRALHRS